MRQYRVFLLSGTGESGTSITWNASNIVHIQKKCIGRQIKLQSKDAKNELNVGQQGPQSIELAQRYPFKP